MIIDLYIPLCGYSIRHLIVVVVVKPEYERHDSCVGILVTLSDSLLMTTRSQGMPVSISKTEQEADMPDPDVIVRDSHIWFIQPASVLV